MDRDRYNREKSPLHIKSFEFAVRIIKMVKYIDCPNKMISCTNQVFRSGTAIGALVREAEFAQSPLDFINKLHISLKECKETELIGEKEYNSMLEDCNELIAILVSSIKTAKLRIKK